MRSWKIGLSQAGRRAAKLIGDSSISNANALCRIQERVELPGLDDVREFLTRHSEQEWDAFSFDVSKAHKRVKVHPSEQGLSLFSLRGRDGSTR